MRSGFPRSNVNVMFMLHSILQSHELAFSKRFLLRWVTGGESVSAYFINPFVFKVSARVGVCMYACRCVNLTFRSLVTGFGGCNLCVRVVERGKGNESPIPLPIVGYRSVPHSEFVLSSFVLCFGVVKSQNGGLRLTGIRLVQVLL